MKNLTPVTAMAAFTNYKPKGYGYVWINLDDAVPACDKLWI